MIYRQEEIAAMRMNRKRQETGWKQCGWISEGHRNPAITLPSYSAGSPGGFPAFTSVHPAPRLA
jgi:hypothetical protein